MLRSLVLAICALQLASALSVQPRAALQLHARPVIARPLLHRMEEETPKPAEVAPAEPVPTPPPAPPEKQFDLTDYSITITLAVVFILAKALAALGIIESSGN